MTYALNGKENCRKRGLLPCRNGLCLLTILNNIKPNLHVYELRTEVTWCPLLRRIWRRTPSWSPPPPVPLSRHPWAGRGAGGRGAPGPPGSSRRGHLHPPAPGHLGQHTAWWLLQLSPSSLLPILKDFSDREGSAKSTVNCYNRRPCPWLVYFLRWPSRPSWWRQQQLQYNSIPAVAIVAASNIWNMNW